MNLIQFRHSARLQSLAMGEISTDPWRLVSESGRIARNDGNDAVRKQVRLLLRRLEAAGIYSR